MVLCVAVAALAACSGANGNDNELEAIAGGIDARVGVVAVCGADTLAVNAGESYPMMSVFKLPIALAALDALHGADMDSMVRTRLRPGTYSPLRERLGCDEADVRIDTLMYYSVCRSDNNACDALIDVAGGTAAVEAYVRGLGIDDMCISQTENDMHADLSNTYRNHCTPLALCRVLQAVYEESAVPAAHREYVRGLLEQSRTGRDKISAGLPAELTVGHKSGLSDRLPDGVLMGSADCASFELPDGRRCYMAVMVRDSRENDSVTNTVFAAAARAVYGGMVQMHKTTKGTND